MAVINMKIQQHTYKFSCHMQSTRCSQSLLAAALYKKQALVAPSSSPCLFPVIVSIALACQLFISSYSVALTHWLIFASHLNISYSGNIHTMSKGKFGLKLIFELNGSVSRTSMVEQVEKAELVCEMCGVK